jgi:hypothetical protein
MIYILIMSKYYSRCNKSAVIDEKWSIRECKKRKAVPPTPILCLSLAHDHLCHPSIINFAGVIYTLYMYVLYERCKCMGLHGCHKNIISTTPANAFVAPIFYAKCV